MSDGEAACLMDLAETQTIRRQGGPLILAATFVLEDQGTREVEWSLSAALVWTTSPPGAQRPANLEEMVKVENRPGEPMRYEDWLGLDVPTAQLRTGDAYDATLRISISRADRAVDSAEPFILRCDNMQETRVMLR